MDKFDYNRIENAIWTLIQYQDDIVNMHHNLRLDEYEMKSMFKTLYGVKAHCEDSIKFNLGENEFRGVYGEIMILLQPLLLLGLFQQEYLNL